MITIAKLIGRFVRSRKASTGIAFSLTMTPLLGVIGAAVDMSNAMRAGDKLQAAVDAGTLAGAILVVDNKDALARKVFDANFASVFPSKQASGTFTTVASADGVPVYGGSASVNISTTVLRAVGIRTITVTRSARAAFGTGDNSCIFSLGGELDLDDNSATFNGTPNVNLTGCTIRSNQSIKCNGSGIVASASIAAGSADGCPNPVNNAGQMKDIYKDLASNIEKKCGTDDGGVTWSTAAVPTGSNVITYSRAGRQVVHICGPLTLTGTNTIAPGGTDDLIIVVENGNIVVDRNADVTANKTTFILTGDSSTSVVDFPNGNGHHGTLRVSAGTNDANPWQGVAVYQDPRLTDNNKNMDWGPGAKFVFDGIAYFPKSDMVFRGTAETGPSACSKLVTNSFKINGGVTLKQNASGCKNQKVAQYQTWPRLLE